MTRRAAWCLMLLAAVAAGCGEETPPPNRVAVSVMTGGDPERGRAKIREYGCHACHTIPGVPGATGKVAAPLTGIAGRMYLAGLLANNPENMILWIRNPPSIDPGTAMPNMGVSEQDARDIAAYPVSYTHLTLPTN